MLAANRKRELKRYGLILHGVGAFAIVLLLCGLQFGVRAQFTAVRAEHQAREADFEEKLEAALNTREEHALLHERLREAEDLATSIRRRIPDQPQESQFLGSITEAADQFGMNIRDFAVGEIRELQTHKEVSVSFGSAGDYEGLCRFLDALMRLPRVVTVEKLTIDSDSEAGVYPFTVSLLLPFAIKSPEPEEETDKEGGDA